MTKNQLLEFFPLGPEFPDHRRFDPISAIAGGVGIVGNIAGGFIQSSAAKKAGQIQQKAGRDASDRMGVATGEANAGIADATKNAQDIATGVSNRYIDTAGAAANGVTGAAREANGLLDPYATTGNTATTALNAGLAAGGDFNKAPSMSDITIDPGYAFRQQQGELALQRSGAAHGGALGGGAIKEALNFNSGLASQEYQNAFNRFQTSTQNRFSNLMTASNAGQAAAGTQGNNLTTGAARAGDFQMSGAQGSAQANEYGATAGMQGQTTIGNNLMNGAKTQGDFLTGAANGEAASKLAAGSAWSNALAGAGNAATSAAFSNALKNPATDSGYYSSSRGYVR